MPVKHTPYPTRDELPEWFAEHFSRFVIQVPGEECHCWIAGKDGRGYGAVHVNGKVRSAHKLAYILANGSVPLGMCVRHKCDNPACVNPMHLELGTHAENMRDMSERGRVGVRRGPLNEQAKLTAEQVHEVLRLRRDGVSANKIGQRFGIAGATVRGIASGRRYSSVTGIPNPLRA